MKNQLKTFKTLSTKISFVFMLCLAVIVNSKAQNQLDLIAVFELKGNMSLPENMMTQDNQGSKISFKFKDTNNTLGEGLLRYECTRNSDGDFICGYKAYDYMTAPSASATTIDQTIQIPFSLTQGVATGLSIEFLVSAEGGMKYEFSDALGDNTATGLTLTDILLASDGTSIIDNGLSASFNTGSKLKVTVAHFASTGKVTVSTTRTKAPLEADESSQLNSGGHAAVNLPSTSDTWLLNLQATDIADPVFTLYSTALLQHTTNNFIIQ